MRKKSTTTEEQLQQALATWSFRGIVGFYERARRLEGLGLVELAACWRQSRDPRLSPKSNTRIAP